MIDAGVRGAYRVGCPLAERHETLDPEARLDRVTPLAALMLAALIGAGCSSVAYFEKKELSRRIMQLDADDLEIAFRNKVDFSREVSGGRPGHSAGGGCGCGN